MQHQGRIGIRIGTVIVAAVAASFVALLSAPSARADTNCVVTQDRSLVSATTATITFANNSGRTVKVFWLDFNGRLSNGTTVGLPYAQLGPGGSYDQGTWLTHPWKAIDSVNGACLGYTLSDVPSKTYVVQPPTGPLNIVAPVAAGAPKPGHALSATPGLYDDVITATSYQWERCVDGPGTCQPIDGAIGPTYRVRIADAGSELRVVESATTFPEQTTVTPSGLVSVASLPAPGLIYFGRTPFADVPPTSIFQMNPDGTGQTRVLAPDVSDSSPAASPDGSLIAFTRRTGSVNHVWVANADGSSPRQVVGGAFYSGNPAWSPDGHTLAFDADNSDGLRHIYTVPADATSATEFFQVTNGPADVQPTWSPDGATIVYSACPSLIEGTCRLFSINSNGDGGLGDLNQPGTEPAFGPDGSQIAFASDTGDIWLVADDGTGAVNITQSPDTFEQSPAWAPDGSQLAYSSNAGGQYSIWAQAPSGDVTATPLTAVTSAGDSGPSWSVNAPVAAPNPDLQVSLACTTHCPAGIGDQVVFTGTVTNGGAGDAVEASVNFRLTPSSVTYTFDSASVGATSCSVDSPVAFCSVGTLAPGASLPVTINATIVSVPEFPANLRATVTASTVSTDSNPDNNSASSVVDILARAVASNVSVIVKPAASEPGAREIPTANVDLSALPTTPGSTASAPIASIPIASIPIASIPIASIPIASIGLTPALLDGIGGVPLSSVPLTTAGGWDARLLGTQLANSMLQVTTLADVMRRAPGALTGLTLRDIGLASSPIASIPIASIALGPLRLSQLPLLGHTGAQNLTDWCAALAAAGFSCSGAKLGDGSDVGSATMASIGIQGAPIASIPIASIPIASIPIASIPIASIAVAGSPIASIPIASIAVAGSPIASIPIASIPIASIANVVDCSGGYSCATKTLGEALADRRIRPGATLADLGNTILSSITLGQLAAFFPLNITLADLLAVLAGPPSSRGYERLPFTELPAQDWASAGGSAIYHLAFALAGTDGPSSATATLTLPAGYRYGGGATLIDFSPTGAFTTSPAPDPTVSATAVSFHLSGLVPGHNFRLDFTLLPSLLLGDSGPVTATVTPDVGTAASGTGANLTVHDTFEPANGAAATAPALSTDTVYLSYVTSATDTDTYRFAAPQAGSHVTVKLVPPVGADYDLALYRPTRTSVVSSPIASIPLDGLPVPDNGVPLTHSTSSQAPETLSDIPIASIPIASISDSRGSAEEVATAVTQSTDAGQFLSIQVSGYQGSTSTKPYALLVTVTPPPDLGSCLPSPLVPTGSPLGTLVAPTATASTLNTLFVVDSRRMQGAYPARAQDVMTSLAALAGRTDLGVTGAVLDVANDPAVTAAEGTWDASPCSPGNANAVARAVSSVVARYTAARPSVKYVVLVGGDDQIPFFRLPDLVTVSNESDYASTFFDHPNQYYGSLASGDVLSDNPYGTPAPTPFFDRYLYVPSLSVGRLVETGDDIVRAVNQFITSTGALSPTTAAVTGYDFLADGSLQIATTQKSRLGTANVSSLVDDPAATTQSPPWSASSLDALLGPSPAGVLSLNAHYDHYRLLPSDQGALFGSATMAAKALAGRYVFTMGCHSGLPVSDIVVGATDTRRLDWAQVYGQGGALYSANTGYGYGDTTSVAYSEELMSLLAKRMDGTVTAGEALMFAKNDFKAALGPVGVYDEKVLSETTFYGLPMYKVGPATALPPAPTPRPTVPDPIVGGGVVAADLSVSPTLTQKSSPFGTYFSSDDTVATNYRPVEPSTSADVTQPNLIAHGALITQLASTDLQNPIDAAFSMPTIDRTATAPEPVFGDAVFPTKIQTIETYAGPRGQQQRLVLVVGQFASDPALAPGHGRQRNFTQVGARVYYAPGSVVDYTPAQFGLVQGAQLGTQAAFSIKVSDGAGTGVKRVLVAYHDGNIWKFVDLQPSAADPTSWTGGGPTSTNNPEFFVQAVDGAGNVAVTSYKGRYYLAPPTPAQGGGLSWTFTGTPGNGGWFRSSVGATVTAPAGTTVNLDGGPFTSDLALTVTGDGVHLLGIRVGNNVTYVPVGIDQTNPTIKVTSPLDGSTLGFGDGTALRFSCADAGSGIVSCAATLNGSPVANGADISTSPGVKTVVVTARDAAGNSFTKTLVFEVHWPFTGFFAPIDNLPTLNVINPGQAVPVKFGLGGNRGLAIFAAGYPAMEPISCSTSAPLDLVEATVTAGNSSLEYDAGSQRYTYVWKTPKTGWPSGACRQLLLKFTDGSTQKANFKAK